MSVERGATDALSLSSDAVLDMAQTSSTQGAMCAVLTPAIKAKLREMAGGQILEIRVNDPTARQDIESWCRLAGHQVLAIAEDQGLLRVYLRKKLG
jgi:TusA-related sulfurtransferase